MFTHHTILKTFVPLCLAGWLGFSYFGRDEARPAATPPVPAAGNPKTDKLKLPPGFKAEHLYSPSENDQGSWVSMTFDPKGRMIASDQYGSLYRIQLPAAGSGGKAKVEKLTVGPPPAPGDTSKRIGMGHAQGLLYAFNSLYVMVNHKPGPQSKLEKSSGLYRLQDTDGNDTYDKVTLLKQLQGEGEHGPHNIVLAPDGKSLYVMAGNFTDVPKMDAYRVPPVWNEDNIFPFIPDPRGHATDRKAPGGWIANVDSSGQRWEYFGGGFRNTYDMAFNEAGDLFCFDSDMEWDFGMPWYKPTRVLHITSGAEFGWRSSSINWSPNFADNLPAVLNVGQGSPTGVFHGKNARFPDKYKKALYIFDWSFGIIYAVHLQPQGASYTATAEEFVAGAPLPLTDGLIGPDGALYFLTGGRRLESDLYRVSYDDQAAAPVAANAAAPATPNDANKLRRSLEAYHGKAQSGAVDAAWPHLKSEDRFIRHAARVAVENQPVGEWQERAFKETDPRTLTTAMIALARHGKPDARDRMLGALTKVNYASLSEAAQLDLLRALELVMYRMGKPEGAARESVAAYLGPHYPAKTNALNRSLSKVLHYLDAPGAVEKTMVLLRNAKDEPAEQTVSASSNLIMRNPQYGLDIAKMLSNVPPAQQTHYATVLSQAKTGWTPALQEEYMKWFAKAFTYKGGHSYIGFIDKARKQALANAPQEKFEAYNKLSGADLLTSSGNDLVGVPQPKGPGKPWKVETALPVVEGALVSRNFEQGKNMFAATLCLSCHAMKGEGGSIGPDLTRLGTRFSNKDILTHIIDPNKEVSDQYAATVFTMKDGSSVVGRLVREDKDKYYVSQNPFAPDMLEEIARKNVTATKLSKVSLMLPGLINRLNDDELRDLMAYLVSGANPQHEAYKPGKAAPQPPGGGTGGKSK